MPLHLSQSEYRHAQSEGLQEKYAEDADIRDGAHMLCALAFVPVEDVESHFDILMDTLPSDLIDVGEYFEVTYVRGKNVTFFRHEDEGERYRQATFLHYGISTTAYCSTL